MRPDEGFEILVLTGISALGGLVIGGGIVLAARAVARRVEA
jgi:hypothetical protein